MFVLGSWYFAYNNQTFQHPDLMKQLFPSMFEVDLLVSCMYTFSKTILRCVLPTGVIAPLWTKHYHRPSDHATKKENTFWWHSYFDFCLLFPQVFFADRKQNPRETIDVDQCYGQIHHISFFFFLYKGSFLCNQRKKKRPLHVLGGQSSYPFTGPVQHYTQYSGPLSLLGSLPSGNYFPSVRLKIAGGFNHWSIK